MQIQKNHILVGSIVLIILAGSIFYASSSTEKTTDTDTKTTPTPTPSAPPALKKLNVGYLPTPGHALTFIAKEQGFLKEQGLDVELFEFTNSGDGLNAIQAGKLDAGTFGTAAPLTFVSKGADFVFIGGQMSEGAGVISKPERAGEFKTLDGFKGKKVATVRLATGDAVWRGALTEAGIDWKNQVEIIELKSPAAVLEAVKTDKADAGVVWLPYMTIAQDQGISVVSYSDEYFPEHPCGRVTLLKGTLGNNRNTWVNFEKAFIQSYKFYNEHPDETVDIISKYVKIDKDLIKKSTFNEHFFASPDPNSKGIIRFWNLMNNIGYINSTHDINQNIDASIYKQALDEVIRENPKDQFYKGLLDEYKKLNE